MISNSIFLEVKKYTFAINSILDKETFMKDIGTKNCFYYSEGTHREWLENKNIFDIALP